MPAWLTIVITIFTALGGTTLMSLIWNRIAEVRAKKREEAKEERQNVQRAKYHEEERQRHDEMIVEIHNAIVPISEDLIHIKSELEKNKVATVSSLRASMMILKDQFKAKGYSSSDDKAAWNQLYDEYKGLGGNFFKNYVDQWKADVNDMPDEPVAEHKKSK